MKQNISEKWTLYAKMGHIRMIFEGSSDTEDWSNGCWKFSFAITGINYIFKYIKNRKQLFKIV